MTTAKNNAMKRHWLDWLQTASHEDVVMTLVEDGSTLESIQNELKQLTPGPEAFAWQPIESAPKDGAPFLVYWRKSLTGGEAVDIMSGWAEYEEILGFGEPPAIAWCRLPSPPSEEGTR